MRELVPRTERLAILVNPTNAGTPGYLADVRDAARRFNLSTVVVEVTRGEDFPHAFASIRSARPDGLLVMVDPLIGGHRAQVIDFAASARLSASYDNANMARDGGLMSYGTLFVEHYAMAANYVDKILRGARPGDLPVEQSKRLEMIVNLKTAKALGMTIPQSLLLRADEVIQ
jgi:putative ABC transport system substrate-binding protein